MLRETEELRHLPDLALDVIIYPSARLPAISILEGNIHHQLSLSLLFGLLGTTRHATAAAARRRRRDGSVTRPKRNRPLLMPRHVTLAEAPSCFSSSGPVVGGMRCCRSEFRESVNFGMLYNLVQAILTIVSLSLIRVRSISRQSWPYSTSCTKDILMTSFDLFCLHQKVYTCVWRAVMETRLPWWPWCCIYILLFLV